MIICALDKMNKGWGGAPVLQNLTVEIHEGDRIGLVGPNGCGKTTVLKLIAGLEPPDSGAIHCRKGARTALLAQIPDYGADTTAEEVLQKAFADLLLMRERMTELEAGMADAAFTDRRLKEYGELQDRFAEMGGYEMEARMLRVAGGLGLTALLGQPFSSLSGGERTKVCLANILLREPDLLLLDEPTNHLDLQALEWLEGHLRDYRGSVVIVSHDRYFLDRVAGKIIDLEGGSGEVYHGNYSYFVVEKERRLLAEFAAFQEQQKKIRKMEEAIKRLRIWAAQADNPKMFKRAAAMQKALDRMDKLDRPMLERKKIGLSFQAGERSGNDVITLKDVKMSVRAGQAPGSSEAAASRVLYSSVNMLVRYREFAAIVGDNGSGKSTLLKMIAEGLAPDQGTVQLGSQVKLGYLAQQDGFVNDEMTILDAFRDAVMVEEGEARHLLAKFLFYGAAVFRKVKALSGGERMRLRLAQLMYQDVNVLMLDEPTNHLDIDAREALEDTLAQFEGTILCVSHDRYLLNKLFPITYWIERGELARYEGFYDEARKKRDELRSSATIGRAEPAKPARKQEIATAAAESIRQTEKQLAKLEAEIAAVERKIAVLDSVMLQENIPEKLTEMYNEKLLLEAEREILYQRME
ncbi:putative ABC transporter ATP-binding protein [Paenibacillus konkukensis]|uniref:ABC transporter ATP-binding protein n=2 Tax=Paenibacillus konkukensis TaxID=2020716 RepID=A0ABY4RDJ7_9BACL|nr:putative ABC transporter ATP-binding protein [Paenibacillus konkukensis]